MELIKKIQSNLSDDLLQERFRPGNGLKGYCYVASEALYHLLGKTGYKPCRAKDNKGITHWWLVGENGKILDPTKEQYSKEEREEIYRRGRCAGFLTKEPSKRAKKLIDRITK